MVEEFHSHPRNVNRDRQLQSTLQHAVSHPLLLGKMPNFYSPLLNDVLEKRSKNEMDVTFDKRWLKCGWPL